MLDRNYEKRVLIVTGGNINKEFLGQYSKHHKYDMIIAVDHGLYYTDQLKLQVHTIVGDFDSVPEELLSKYKELSVPIQTYPAEKDMTDTQIALEYAIKNKASYIEIFGATGSRMDHTLANINLLALPGLSQIETYIVDEYNKIYLKNNSFSIRKLSQFGDYISLMPFYEKVTGLTLKGFKYPLNSIILSKADSLGISNEIIEDEAEVIFDEGTLIVIESRD